MGHAGDIGGAAALSAAKALVRQFGTWVDDLAALTDALAPNVTLHLSAPFETLQGVSAVRTVCDQVAQAFPDLERRDTILMAGRDGHDQLWVGVCGYYCGLFAAPFLDIPPTQRFATLRYHEFFRLKDGKIVEGQAIWDLPDLMMQAGAWPLGPSLGRELLVPGPATQDGLTISGDGTAALARVTDMLDALKNNRQGEAAMRLPEYWHPKMTWYGPSGIGTARGIQGFRSHHQIPFLNAMPDRRAFVGQGHAFAEGSYVGFTAWPGMAATLTGDGWLGLPPTGAELTMRSLDFWRVEGDLIRENWVLVDLLHVYMQLGVDVLARMRELRG